MMLKHLRMATFVAIATALPFAPRAALAQAQPNTEIVCEVAGYDIFVRNDGDVTIAAETTLRWYVPFTREHGFHTLSSALEPGGRSALISGVLTVAILDGAPCDAVVFDLGEPREDLARFHGLYGDPGNADAPRFVVAEAQTGLDAHPGFLMISPANAGAMYLRSVADTQFEQWLPADGDPVVVAFETGAEGAAIALVFEAVMTDLGRLERLGDAP